MYSVKHNNVFFALLVTSFGHHQAITVPKKKIYLIIFEPTIFCLFIIIVVVAVQLWPDDGHTGRN